ncbi:guanine nucleotide-binding protein G(I)/G(S)/G(O) subunit gamma-10-like [Glossophaga mutica]
MSAGGSVIALQRLGERLKLQAGVERIKVSQAAAELQQHCTQNACKDALLVGIPAESNPFREPRSCALFTLNTGKTWAEEPLQVHSDDCLLPSLKKAFFPNQMSFRYFRPSRWPGPIAKIL